MEETEAISRVRSTAGPRAASVLLTGALWIQRLLGVARESTI